MKKRVFLIVLDSVGAGELPDAADFGDAGVNTLKSVSASPFFEVPNMLEMGLGFVDGLSFLNERAHGNVSRLLSAGCADSPHSPHSAAVAKLGEMSRGKDTTIGHWEIMGLISKDPLPVYPDGFPDKIIEAF
ncbi:MAG: hypothetical protein IJZ90_02090, partial [Clostridia bacterium]|nr:hypothetical protein [Clostridia bacterium]